MPSVLEDNAAQRTPAFKNLNYAEAVNAALRRTLEDVPETLLYGEDVAKPGGVFGVTRRLHRDFTDRVFDTPISESAILGSAVGAAMMGLRPIVEIMWADFSLVALDQIVNQLVNVRYINRGEVVAPVVIRTQQGYGPGACAQHSQSLESLFLSVPGLRVCMPRTPQDAYDLLLQATASDDPVLVIENRTLYRGDRVQVEVDGPIAPIGGSRLRRTGTDVTVVSWGMMTGRVLGAAAALEKQGISIEVVETPWLNPLDYESVVRSLAKTRGLLVVHEANITGGFGAEVIAHIVESGVVLSMPPRRLGVADSRIPAAPTLANALVPNEARIVDAVLQMMNPRAAAVIL